MGAPQHQEGKGRSGRPLARRFAYRSALAVAGFLSLAVASLATFNHTLDVVDSANAQLEAVANQGVRVRQLATMADILTRSGVDPETVGEGVAVGEIQVRFISTLEEFRRVHLGLTAGTGTSGLPGPTEEQRAFWDDPNRAYADTLQSFHEQANTLLGLLGTAQDDPESLTTVNDLIQAAADPRTGAAAGATEDAIAEYSDHLDGLVESQRSVDQALVALTVAMALIAILALFRPLGHRIQMETTNLRQAEREARENNERQLFRTSLARGLEGAGNEDEILGRVATAMAEVATENRGELLLIDTTGAHLRHVQANPEAGSPGCPVDDPRDCMAIRRSQPIRFETSRALDVCPKLPLHDEAPCSAVCSPVLFLGQALGVLHITGPDLTPLGQQLLERWNVVANETGSRLGTLRATRQTELQASTDGLTGLPNRRSLEAAADDLVATGRPFAIAIADLDHFKVLNDTHGHEAGDRALRLFARTLRTNLRPDDMAARYGGEEFVLLLPNASVREARAALERLRVTLAGDIAAANSLPFTASWGLTSSDTADSFSELIHAADEALYAAKRAGRNRVVVAAAAQGIQPQGEPAIFLDDGGNVIDSRGNIIEGGEIIPDAEGGGWAATSTCDACWFENPLESKFCLRCGAALGEQPASGTSGSRSTADGDGHHGGGDEGRGP